MPMTAGLPKKGLIRLAGPASLAVLCVSLVGLSPARAQVASECEKIGKLSQDRARITSQIQVWQKSKAKPTAAAVCSTFSSLQSNGNALIKMFEENGAWCHIPDAALQGLKQQQVGVGKTRATACSAAAKMKTMEAQRAKGASEANRGPLGGTGDILGGPIKAPQGAL
jgi:hypothetical protein